jgi:hypothetical protein
MHNQKVAPARPALKKTRSIRDCASGNWGVEFEIIQMDGQKSRVLVPADDAESERTLVRRLNEKGAQLPRQRTARSQLLDTVIDTKPERIVYRLANPGWQLSRNKMPWFCCGRRLVGAPRGAIEYSPPLFIEQSRAKGFAVRRTLDAWRTRVAQRAMWSPTASMGALRSGVSLPIARPSM